MRSSARALPILAALIPFISACASAPAPAPPAPAPADVADTSPEPAPSPTLLSIEPPPAAVRAAENVALTGRELGTMWTFENPPLEYWRTEYGLGASQEWLDHVRLSSVRYGEYCSASFVSPDGLVVTNHHCARECVESNSTPGTDYVITGFMAERREDERLCEDLFLDQLVGIEDVTKRVHEAVPAGATGVEIATVQAAEVEAIENECAEKTGNTCQVVALFQGGQHQLYQYRRYQPVKLVFAPELQAGFFGGDPDNFTYPRYNLDFAFVRAYAPDSVTPASTPHYFEWSKDGAAEGDVVFVTGNPGSTSRLITVSQLMYERVYRHPFLVQITEGQKELLQSIAERGPQYEMQVREDLFGVENVLKKYKGELAGLRDTLLVAKKIRWEQEFRGRVNADPKLRAEFGNVWTKLANLQVKKLEVSPPLNVANPQLVGGPHLVYAAQLVTYVGQMALPEADRDPQFQAAAGELRSSLMGRSGADPEIARATLAMHIGLAEFLLGPGDPLRDPLIRQGETAEQAAARLMRDSRVMDAAFRRSLIEGGKAALEASTDPLVVWAREAVTVRPGLLRQWQEIQAAETVERQRLASALFAVFGTSLPPDATFTLRISDGVVKRYEYNGTLAPAFTTYYGLYGRAADFGNRMPWTLPEMVEEALPAVSLATPLNFVSTLDITGGNSGSPIIDREGRLVGLAFDGNIEQLPNEYVFRDDAGRTVGVHSAGILEALRAVYKAEALLTELLGYGTGEGNP